MTQHSTELRYGTNGEIFGKTTVLIYLRYFFREIRYYFLRYGLRKYGIILLIPYRTFPYLIQCLVGPINDENHQITQWRFSDIAKTTKTKLAARCYLMSKVSSRDCRTGDFPINLNFFDFPFPGKFSYIFQ